MNYKDRIQAAMYMHGLISLEDSLIEDEQQASKKTVDAIQNLVREHDRMKIKISSFISSLGFDWETK